MSSSPAGSGLPAWKRALLERKRAKLAAGVEPERGRAEAGEPQRQPPEGPGREGEEHLVVAESLGPLRENPFMRLEGERRRRRRRFPPPAPEPPPAPLPQDPPALTRLLELYSAVPGIRTIRADNILIIESKEPQDAPGPANADPPRPPASPPPQPDPLRDLLSRSGSALTEIRAAEVVIYEPEPLSASALSPTGDSEAGRVSRLLQKFDRRPRSHAAKGRWRGLGGATPQPVVPNISPKEAPTPPPPPQEPVSPLPSTLAAHPSPPCGLQPGGFVQKTGSNSFMVNPRGCRPTPVVPRHIPPVLSNGPVDPEMVAPPPPSRNRSQQAATAAPKLVPSPSPAAVSLTQANVGKPKPKEVVESLPPPQSSAIPDSSATASLSRPTLLLSSNCSFEIRPAPKPDLAAIPAHDLQAQALASLRLNSRNSFLFVPRRKDETPSSVELTDSPAPLPGGALPSVSEKPAETLVPVTYIDEDLLELEAGLLPPLRVLSPRLEGFDVPQESNSALEMEESVLSVYSPLPTGAVAVSQKGSNTFTIVPKRKPPSAGLETFSRIQLLKEEEEEEEESQAKAKTDAPDQELGHLLKKRYPTVNEIEVIGGYLSLDKSCMSKSGSRRKKMKISFNESSLQTMFEYPSESSLVEEEEGEEEEYATEVDEAPGSLAPHLDATDSGLSSYTPKHSIEFSKWQEQQYEGMPLLAGAFPRDADLPGSQVMLTPADKSSLADFSSEPALYF